MSTIFEEFYQQGGIASQRRYPNEALMRFIGSNYFSMSHEQRNKLKVLEIGCGSGANLWMLSKEGFDSYGIDIAPTGLKYCHKVMADWGVAAQLFRGDMTAIEFPDQFFDLIIDVVSMQHLNIMEHSKAYSEIYRCLKKGGRLFQYHLGARSVTFLNGGGTYIDAYTIDNAINKEVPLNNAGRTCFLTPIKAKEMLDNEGFVNVSIEVDTRSYRGMTQQIEYLSISAEK
ncbi:class I SAM-dependent methyltransferase [Azotosporobacter soli]|uniref:class I SAM-dependent methyltransferase n=1 Tax=Azotosporobacter soli TaxID=3055040 RepID=UPI0031FF15D3